MTTIARGARAHFGTVMLCALVLLGVSACGADDVASNAANATATSSASLVSSRAGTITRQPATTTQPATATLSGGGTSNRSSGSGSTSSKLPVPASSGTATLDWLPPTQNSDGSTLSNLAGFMVYYGTSPDQLTHSVKLANPGLTAYTVSNLSPGTWYFAVASYTSAGIESTRSGVVSTKI